MPDSTETEESAEELFEHAPCGYVITDTDGRIIRANATFGALCGSTAEALRGALFPDLLTVAGRDALPVVGDGEAHDAGG